MKTTRRRFIASTTAVAATLATRRAQADPAPLATPYILHFAQPATKWPDALPVGNGRLGAMVFGHPSQERIQLNEESIWDGQPNLDRANPRAAAAVPKIRELLFAGQTAEAEALATTDMLSIPQRMPCYQTLGDLHLTFTNITGPVEDYRLELNLDTAICTTTFTHAGVRYTREVFSSAPDQVIAIRLTASEPRKISLRATIDRPVDFNVTQPELQRLVMIGQALPVNDNPGLPHKEPKTGVRFHSELRLIAEGKSASFPLPGSTKGLEVEHADTVTLLIDCATSYRHPSTSAVPSGLDAAVLTGNPEAMQSAVTRNLTSAAHRKYEDLRARHIADHQQFFRRADISFGPDPNAATPTDQRVRAMKSGKADDLHLIPLYFQFGRYMLISSSRPNTLAANLQGIWNEAVDPPWGSKYTININAQMNYWLAERANLSDLATPLFDLVERTVPSGTQTAKKYYNAAGSVAHHNTDIWGDTGPIDGLGGGIWPMGAAWLSLHFWDHYEYSADPAFLRTRAFPALRQSAAFLLDYLVEAPAGTPYAGHLVTGPSCSPENKYKLPNGKSHNLCMGPTMDLEITRAVLTRTIDAATALSIQDPILSRAREALTKLPPLRITHDGRLQEWPEDYADQEPGHRHISHLFALFPGDAITPTATPDLARACRATLDARLAAGGGSTGWSRSWIIACMARLHDGDAAWQNILELFVQSTRQNLFDVCGLKENSPFQIDGNLGAPAALTELLIQSHEQSKEGSLIRLLPALPSAWPEGSFRGLRARGGLEIDLTWSNSKATRATLRSTTTRTHTLIPPPNQSFAPTHHPNPDRTLTLHLKPNTTHQLTFA